MKKTLSLVLSFVMLLSITAGFNFSAQADSVEYTAISTNGTWHEGYLDDKNTEDWYKISIPSDGKIIIKIMHYETFEGFMYNQDFSSCIWNGSYILNGGYNSEGLSGGTSSSPITTTITRILSKGTYFISLNKYHFGKYKISVTFNSFSTNELEPNDFENAMYLNSNEEIIGAFTYQDNVDWYKIYIPQKADIKINIKHYMTMEWYLYNSDLSKCILDGSYILNGGYNVNGLSGGSEDSPVTNTYDISLSKGTYYIKMQKRDLGKYKFSWLMNINVSKPSSLKVSARKTTSLKLSWSKVSGASGYQLQQYKSNKWTTIKTASSTSYTVSKLKTGTKYYFRVRAYKKVNGKYYYSAWTKLTTPTKPATISISSVKSSKSKSITVKWKKVTCSGYQIQYSTSKKFTSKTTKTVAVKGTVKSKTISKLKGKKKYYVRVRAYKTVNGTKYYGAWSKVKSVTTKK